MSAPRNPAAGTGESAPPRSLYARREKIYPRESDGRFASLRVAAMAVLLGVFYALPWIEWNGRQAVLFDLPARKFHVFGLTLWPQDLFYLTALLVIAALSLFLVTALFGRVWCGYACPQTVWTEIFVWMERLTEGSSRRRMKLDRAPWSAEKIARKGAKQFLWIGFALFTGFTFVGYFTPVHVLADKVASLSLGGWETFWIAFYGFATYGNAGFMREQVCKYMCPYARFQSAMFDRNTLIVSYDTARGEPRGKRRRDGGAGAGELGDCINCTKCVQVCPTGIDIRDGLQYECIACAACIDVCDEVMDAVGYPRGLVRYTTENALAGRPARLVRPRVVVYTLLLLGLSAAVAVSLFNRTPLRFDILRDRNALYRVVDAGLIENVYSLRVMNMDDVDHTYVVETAGLPGATIDPQTAVVAVPAGELRALATRVRAPADTRGRHEITFRLRSRDEAAHEAREPATFIGPVAGPAP